ncbi:MAG: hypothetical protein MHM6MM_008293 [Cercozoa sp. M6MM]
MTLEKEQAKVPISASHRTGSAGTHKPHFGHAIEQRAAGKLWRMLRVERKEEGKEAQKPGSVTALLQRLSHSVVVAPGTGQLRIPFGRSDDGALHRAIDSAAESGDRDLIALDRNTSECERMAAQTLAHFEAALAALDCDVTH